jgi:putative NADH-flavin reductase
MNIIVFGATGMVGKQIVQQALFTGHHVKAFGRNVYTTDFLNNENLQLVQGALFDEQEVYNAIKGGDTVLSALGGGFDGSDKTRSLGMKNIITQMQKTGVKRIIGIGGMGVLNADENTLLIDTDDYPPEYIPVGKEHQKAYELLKESGLDWTFVCAPDIKNEGPTGAYITAADYPPSPNNYRINAGDLAMFMLNEMQKNEYIQHRVGISN